MGDDYKAAKEAFVSDMMGSSITHINLLSLVALSSVSLYAALYTRSRRIGFFASWALLVLPLLLSMTVAAGYPLLLSALLLLPTIAILRTPRAESGTPLPSSQPSSPSIETKPPAGFPFNAARFAPLPALTTYRAHMMLMTVLAILAVDFPVFPRFLAKCETYGVSLMDMGVGSFVFSQGIVSAIPLVKDPYHITSPLLPKIWKVTTKSLPVIALGVIRVLLVKGTEYPEHVTEYGVHWNFFITLALLPIIQVILHPFLRRLPVSLVGVLVALLQQYLLSRWGLKEYVLSAPRTSLVSMNKEGIVSLTGYLSIHLLGLSIGTMVLPPTPSFFRRRQDALLDPKKKNRKRRNSNPSDSDSDDSNKGTDKHPFDLSAPRQTAKTATELCAYAIMWWAALGLTWVVGVDGSGLGAGWGGVSRRMVNLPYILWVTAYNTSFLLGYLLVLDMGIFATPKGKKKSKKMARYAGAAVGAGTVGMGAGGGTHAGVGAGDSEDEDEDEEDRFLSIPGSAAAGRSGAVGAIIGVGNPPRLLEVINRHGLLIFLVANVLTGLVNLSLSTMYVRDGWAIGVLSAYSMGLCALGWFWKGPGFGARR